MLFAWLGDGIPGVLTSCLLIAAGDAFRSGADQALLYRSCLAVGEPAFQRREAHARGLQLAALVVLVLAGGAIVKTWGFAAGWLVETLLSAFGLAIALAMVEPPAQADENRPESPSSSGADAVTLQGSRPVRQLGALIALIAPAAVLGSAASAGVFLVQSASDGDPVLMTVFVAAATLAEAAGSFVGARMATGTRGQLLLIGLGIGMAAAALGVSRAFHPAVAALCFLTGVAYPLRAAAIQRVAADNLRARAASLASACDKVAATVALLWAGVAPRRRSH